MFDALMEERLVRMSYEDRLRAQETEQRIKMLQAATPSFTDELRESLSRFLIVSGQKLQSDSMTPSYRTK